MTGHLLYGNYYFKGDKWQSDEKILSDSFNQFIHLVFSLSNDKHLAFSDMRKFAKVTFFETKNRERVADVAGLGPGAIGKICRSLIFKNNSTKNQTAKSKPS